MMTRPSGPGRREAIALFSVLGVGGLLPAQAHAETAPRGTTGASSSEERWSPEGWSLSTALSEEFDSPEASRRWERGLWYPLSGAGDFLDENVLFDAEDSVLRLRATPPEEGSDRYGFAAVESYADLPGVASYVEVRAKMLDSAANVLSAIWQQSSNHDHVDHLLEGANPMPEIDVQELFHDDSMDMALHTWEDGEESQHIAYGGSSSGLPGVTDLSAEHHLYGVERRDGRLRFFLDRTLAWDVEAPHPSLARMSRHQVLSLEGHRGDPVPEHLPADFEIDAVHVYYRTAGRRAADGAHHIVNVATGRTLTGEGDALRLAPSEDSVLDPFVLTETDDFTYTIDRLRTGSGLPATLSLEGGAGQVGVPVVLARTEERGTDDAGSRQRWHVLEAADGSFSLRSKFSGLALTPAGDGLDQQEYTAAPEQRWELIPVREPRPRPGR